MVALDLSSTCKGLSEFVRVEVADGIATIRLDRPKMNALSKQVQAEIADAAAEVSADSAVRAVILYGGERVFAAGADIKEMAVLGYPEMAERSAALQASFTAVAGIPKPVVAAVTGYALGGGLELALCADFRVLGVSAKVGQPEILLGVIPGAGGTQRLPRLIGPAKAKDLIFTGRPSRRWTRASRSIWLPGSRSSGSTSPRCSPRTTRSPVCTASWRTVRERRSSRATEDLLGAGKCHTQDVTDDGGDVTDDDGGGALSLEMVAAALRLDSGDAAIYASVLTKSLSEALPPGYVTVERERSMSDRMRGRPGEVSKVAVKLGDQTMTLAVKNGLPVAEICREVRGVVLSRQVVPLQQWASALASALVTHAAENAQAAEALRRLVIGS